jgi:WD40 repeat protein
MPTSSRSPSSSPMPSAVRVQSPTKWNSPTPDFANPYLGPVPEGALARLGNGSPTQSVFSPDGRDWVVASPLGAFAYDADSLAAKWSFLTTDDEPVSLAFSADGDRLGFGTIWGAIAILDSHTGRQITAWQAPDDYTGFPSPIRSLAFSPDGTMVAGISYNGAFLWNSADGRLLRTLYPRGSDDPCGVDFSPDGKILAGARGDRLTLWSVPDGQVIRTLSTEVSIMMAAGVENYLIDVEFLPDGKTLMTNDGTIWDLQTGKILRVLEDFASVTLSVSFDGSKAAGDTGVWDISTGELLWSYPTDYLDRINSTVFSPTRDLLAISANTGVVLLDAASGQYQKALGLFFDVSDTAFSSDGKWIIGWDGSRFLVWDADSLWLRESFSGGPCKPGCAHIASPTGQEYAFASPVRHDEIRSPDQTLVMTFARQYESIILRETASGQPVAALPPASGAAFSPDGRILATAGGGILLWDVAALRSGELPLPPDIPTSTPPTPTVDIPQPTVPPLPSRKLTPGAGAIFGLAYSPEPSRLTVATAEGVYIVRGDVIQEKWRWEYTKWSDRVAVSPDGTFIATDFELWGVTASRVIRTFSGSASEGFMVSPAFSTDGKLLASATEKGIAVWSTATGGLLHREEWDPDIFIDDLAFSPDSKKLAIGAGTRLYIWDLEQDAIRGPESTNCRGDTTFDQAFSPDGGMLLIACGSSDYPLGFLSFWDMSLQRLDSYWDETASFRRLAFSPNGRLTAMGFYDGRIRLRGSGVDVVLPAHGESRDGIPFGPNGAVPGSEHEVTALAFSTDGRTLASGSLDGSLILTDLAPLAAAPPANESKYASDAAPSGCALEPGYVVHARANVRLWSAPDVSSGYIIREPPVGQALYVLGGPMEGWIRTDKSAKGWFWEVSLDADGRNPGWVWQTRIEECPEKY